MQPQHQQFLEQLQAAFPSDPIEARGAFGPLGTTYPDAEPYMNQLDGKSWDQLDRAYFVRRSDALGFLDSHHLAAVLPVYLRAMVEDGVRSPATGMLTLILARPLPGEDTGLGTARFDGLVDALTGAQCAAIACALRLFAEQDPEGSPGRAAFGAIDSYWKTYLPAHG